MDPKAAQPVEVAECQARLKEQFQQLRRESKLFERAMYKSKNQHRRCLYYRSLSKVRRDLKLFENANLKNILQKHFPIIRGDKPTQAISLLESLKVGKKAIEGVDFQKRLLGAARLLAQMTEPIIEAGLKISTLLGQNFFVPFALTMLACLARLRVLVQQILLDLVCVFNMSASASQVEQSSRLTKEGPAVFRDYHPPNKQLLILECHWDGVKFCLDEKLAESERKFADLEQMALPEDGQGTNVEALLRVSAIKYNSTGGWDEDADESNQDGFVLGKRREEQSINEAVKNKMYSNENPAFHIRKEETDVNNSNGHRQDCSQVGLGGNDSFLGSGMSKPFRLKASHPTELSSGTKRKVAFISLDLPSKTSTELESSSKKFKAVPDVGPSEISPLSAKESLDSFFNLLFDGNNNGSLF